MSLPPVTPRNPLSGFLKADQDPARDKTQAAAPKESGAARDTVEISEAAQQRLKGIGTLSGDDPARIRTVAAETRDILADKPLSLGLDPAFGE